MRYYPLFADLQKRICLVVGRTSLCEEKASQLRRAGATVQRTDSFAPEQAAGAFLIVADVEREEGERIRAYGDNHHIFVNIVDKTDLCSFIIPALVEQEDLLIAVSSSAKSPALSGWIRRRLQREFGSEFAEMLRILGEMRARIQNALPDYEERKQFYFDLFEEGLLEQARTGGGSAVRRRVLERLDQVLNENPA